MRIRLLGALVALFAVVCPAHAIVTGSYAPLSYSCNGVTTAYSVTWTFSTSTDLVVTKTSSTGAVTTLALTTNYTVSGAGSSSGGTVTLVSGGTCASGYTLKIRRSTPLTQPTSFRTQGNFSPATHEAAYDRLLRQVQEAVGGQASLLGTDNTWTGTNAFAPTGSNKTAISAAGTGTGYAGVFVGGTSFGIHVTGGDNALGPTAIYGKGGPSGGIGVTAEGTGASEGLQAVSATGYGASIAGNATRAPVHLTPQALPSTPAAGDIIIDSGASNAFKYYDGSAWQSAGGVSLSAANTWTDTQTFTPASGNKSGVVSTGKGTGNGGTFTGGDTDSGSNGGIVATGGTNGGTGVFATGTNGYEGVFATGQGSAAGLKATGGASGRGVTGIGKGASAGVHGSNLGTGHGVHGTGGVTSGDGVRGVGGASDSPGVHGLGGSSDGHGVVGEAAGTGSGVVGSSGSGAAVLGVSTGSGPGMQAASATGNAIYLTGNATRAPIRLVAQAQPTDCTIGEIYYDSGTSKLRVCTVSGTPGTWTDLH